jgi:hypothetical protein
MTAIGCHLAGGLFPLAVTWTQEWSAPRKGCLLLAVTWQIGCYLEAGVESHKEGMPAIGCHLAGVLFLLAVTWKQEWSPTRKGRLLLAVTWKADYSYWLLPGSSSGSTPRREACYWLSPGRRTIPIGCYLEARVKSPKEGMPAIGCHLAGGLFLLAVT